MEDSINYFMEAKTCTCIGHHMEGKSGVLLNLSEGPRGEGSEERDSHDSHDSRITNEE